MRFKLKTYAIITSNTTNAFTSLTYINCLNQQQKQLPASYYIGHLLVLFVGVSLWLT